jgi:hypothetical protein
MVVCLKALYQSLSAETEKNHENRKHDSSFGGLESN